MRLGRVLAALSLMVAAPTIAQTAPAVPPLAYVERTLPNGLRVFAIRDTGTSNVSVQVWYHVGSKDDPAGRSGFAHLFEHLMFKATRNLAPEQFDRLTEDVGGYNNASTGDDYTNFYEVVPANHLERLLFAEADRMASLVVDTAGLASERGVVKEELRQRTTAQPYGALLTIDYPETAYATHPYARPGIGSLADLQAASIDDVRAFHATYYRPDNAVLVVAGNFDPAQLDAWIDRYFAPLTRPADQIPRVTVAEPKRTAAVTRTVYAANTPLPAVLMSWHVPPDRDADVPALTMLNAILSTGESARLNRTLVYRDGIAQSAESFLDTREGVGNFVAYAVLAGGKPVAAVEAALRREIARMRDTLVTDAELARAKNLVLTETLRSRETAEGRGMALAAAVLIDGDPRATDRQVAALTTVTAADIRRVARAYLTERQAVTLRYLPLDRKPAGARAVTIAPTVRAQALVRPASLAVITPAVRPIQPPVPGAPPIAMLPHPDEMRLANGMRVVTVERHGLPLVSATLVATGGAATDPADRAGVSSLMAELLTKGTATRGATAIAQEVEALGGSINASAGRDGATIELAIKADQLAAGMTVLADVALHPRFASAEIARARVQAIDATTVQLADPAQVASLVAARAVWGGHPYGAPLGGTPASLRAIDADDLRRAYSATFRPEQATLLMVGDITPAQASRLAQALFGGWRAAMPAPPSPPASAQPLLPRVIVVDMPSAGQAAVVIARRGVARSSNAYYPLLVANAVLGGSYSSRLNQEVRIKRGLAYGAESSLTARALGGTVSARTQTTNAVPAQAVQLIVGEMARLGADRVDDQELAARKAATLGEFGRAAETTDGIADILADDLVTGIPLSELDRYAARVEAIGPDAVRAAATLLQPDAASIVVVGDSKAFLPALRRTYPNVEVIAQAALVLDRPALR